jgi:hypothetical protein
MPRHPPCALTNLTTQQQTHPRPPAGPSEEDPTRHPRAGIPTKTLRNEKSKMLASTVQFSTTHPRTAPDDPTSPRPRRERDGLGPGRPRRDNNPHPPPAATCEPSGWGPFPQDPTARLRPATGPPTFPTPASRGRTSERAPGTRPNWSAFHPRAPPGHAAHPPTGGRVLGPARHPLAPPTREGGVQVLLRKEVIQPHLPVRLPCYDFVPIADPAFDGSLPPGVGPPASGVTDFRDVTGGVYKARERIHRSVADLRLLATPTSWGRVADPNPN